MLYEVPQTYPPDETAQIFGQCQGGRLYPAARKARKGGRASSPLLHSALCVCSRCGKMSAESVVNNDTERRRVQAALRRQEESARLIESGGA